MGRLRPIFQLVVGKGVRQETHFVPEMPSPSIAALRSAALPGSCLTLVASIKKKVDSIGFK
jgi:hypothetical protein